LPALLLPDIVPAMPEAIYIAELSAADYPRFRDKDPKLPATHVAWAEATDRRVRTARRAGARVILHPIDYAEFEAFLAGIGLSDFGGATRDCYATDMARMKRAADRR
jgi:hypothetical protein